LYHGHLRTTLSSIRDYCILALSLLAAGCAGAASRPQKITVAAAADLQFAMPEIVRQFHQENPQTEVGVIYGSSGNFAAQIRAGAPFDLFLSADVEYARQLAQDGFAAADSLFRYAVGRIVVWAPSSSGMDVAQLQARALNAPTVQHVAIANPLHAPYGRAAEAALRSLGVYDAVQPKLVLGENIAQTLAFVQSGAAQVGIVAMSLAVAPAVRGQGSYWEIPQSAYPEIQQAGTILSRGRGSQAAARFRAFLLSAPARRILTQYGFAIPEHR
jgi:molybdate transport system substrate-binding protein